MDVVREGIERAPGSEVESGVVPQAGEEPLLDLAAVQWEAHMRAAVVDCRRLAVAPEDANRLGTDLARQDTRLRELLNRADRRPPYLLTHLVDLPYHRSEP
jgi:hypothetical protein